MQTNYEAEQLSMFGQDLWYGKMFPAPLVQERQRAKTSESFWRRSSALTAIPFQSLDLTPGAGNLLGEFYWELISPWRGGASTLNTGVSPRDAKESSLSQILQADPPLKYYLSPKACLGILRRAFERGKELPKKLERALKIQAGLMRPDGQPTGLEAYHINQRDEGIDLHGVSGALLATTNMQMQTFVTQPDDTVEGFDGYNGDLTGDVAATLGANCGMSTGRNGVMAFAANQRDEVRDLHDIAGALNTSVAVWLPGKEDCMKQSNNNKKSRDVTAFLYERLSRDDNMDGESYSIGNQKKLLTKVAKEKGYTNLVHFLTTASPVLRWIVPALPT